MPGDLPSFREVFGIDPEGVSPEQLQPYVDLALLQILSGCVALGGEAELSIMRARALSRGHALERQVVDLRNRWELAVGWAHRHGCITIDSGITAEEHLAQVQARLLAYVADVQGRPDLLSRSGIYQDGWRRFAQPQGPWSHSLGR